MKNYFLSFKHAIFFLFAFLATMSQKTMAQFNDTLKIDYFGQKPPGNKAEVFAPDFISRKDWFVQNGCFSPDGKEFVFTITDNKWSFVDIMHTKYVDGKWCEPETLFVNAAVPCFSWDGTSLYLAHFGGETNRDVWVSKRGEKGWGTPEKIPYPVSPCNEESIAANGTFYFSSDRSGGYGSNDLYKAELVNGKYEKAENLGEPINTLAMDECPYISPDESFLVFNCWKHNSKFKGNNLYVSFRDKQGRWSAPKDLGASVNTDDLDIYPNITPDGKYLLYTRREFTFPPTYSKIYWISTSVLDSARMSHDTSSQPISIPKDEFQNFEGVYSNQQIHLTITITQDGNNLTLSVAGYQQILTLEKIGQDILCSNGVTLRFKRLNNNTSVNFELSDGRSFDLTKTEK